MNTDPNIPTTGAPFDAWGLTGTQEIRIAALRESRKWHEQHAATGPDDVLDIADGWADWITTGSRQVDPPPQWAVDAAQSAEQPEPAPPEPGSATEALRALIGQCRTHDGVWSGRAIKAGDLTEDTNQASAAALDWQALAELLDDVEARIVELTNDAETRDQLAGPILAAGRRLANRLELP